MIAYFPEIYPDETIYSLFCRYYAHMGYPAYINALDDLLENRNAKADVEFCGRLNPGAKQLLEKNYGLEYLIKNHTMFPQYARFTTPEKRDQAILALTSGEGNIRNILCFPMDRTKKRFRYCPCCVEQDRKKYGETYWHRDWFVRGVDVCPVHRCRLVNTEVAISGSSSPRLYVAEDMIGIEEKIESAGDAEIALAEYVLSVFHAPLNDSTAAIGTFLTSKLEGKPYISARGKVKKVSLLQKALIEHYSFIDNNPFQEAYHIQKILSGRTTHMYEVCLIAYFLEVRVEELLHPILPEQSQTERYNKMAAQLYAEGKGCYLIARELGGCPSTALKANRKRNAKPHDYGVRKGMQKEDWESIDERYIGKVREVCERIYNGVYDNGRPHRVTAFAVTKVMGWPDKRFDYLPRCRALVKSFYETQEQYWAREAEWAWKRLCEEKDPADITWRNIRDLTNIRRKDYESSIKYVRNEALRIILKLDDYSR